MDEVRILQELDHESIIQIKEVFDSTDYLYLVLELIDGGELFDRIISKELYPEVEARKLFNNLLSAVSYLHSKGISHRDLKPENILLKHATKAKGGNGDDTTIKLTDFGLSRALAGDELMTTMCGTPQYLAPEVLSQDFSDSGGYTAACDLWSLGVVLFICVAGYPPFYEEHATLSLFEQIKTGTYEFNPNWWKGISAEVKDLISHLLVVDPTKRYTAAEAAAHPWTTGKKLPAAAKRVSSTPKRKLFGGSNGESTKRSRVAK